MRVVVELAARMAVVVAVVVAVAVAVAAAAGGLVNTPLLRFGEALLASKICCG